MPCRTARCFLAIALVALATVAYAQTPPDEATAPALSATTWTFGQGTNAQTRARNCSVFPLRAGIYPFFYLEPGFASMSIEGAKITPLDLTLQVDANASLDGGFEPTPKVIAALIAQIRATGETLHVSYSVIANKKLETATDDIVLDGAELEGRLASMAFCSFRFDRQLEIGVETRAEYRGRGYALHAACALIDECVAQGLEPVWSCRKENLGSYRLAQALGFEPGIEVLYYRLPGSVI